MAKKPKRRGCLWLVVLLFVLSLFAGNKAAETEPTALTGPTPVTYAATTLAATADQPATTSESSSELETSSTLTATFIDVGQGDSELIELPDGKVMLVDAGEAAEGQTVVGTLHARGIDTIDYLVATHPHADHVGGMPAVFAATDVEDVWMPNATHTTQTFEAFLDAVEAEGCDVHEAKSGETIGNVQDAYTIDILAPEPGTDSDDLNDYSAVIRIRYGDTALLFTGDASADGIVASNPGHVDLLKAAHHGSRTGTDASVMAALTPSYVILSYAQGNDYGHPHQSVLDAINAPGAIAYATAANGTITATSDGRSLSIATERDGSIVASDRSGPSKSQDRATGVMSGGVQGTSVSSGEAQVETVYVTKTGKKYHRDGCSSLKKSKIAISQQEAIDDGYEPCKRCKP